jgi:GMP synthase (glutamine-hydrolysing)
VLTGAGGRVDEVVAVRHVCFEDLGSIETVLRERGLTVTYLEAGRGRLTERVERRAPRLLVLLGGPIGVNDNADYPFLAEEVALVRARLSRREPVLGICLGAQLIAAAMGARVYPAGLREIGWGPVQLSAAGRSSPLAELTTPVLHWHGDTFDLPVGASHLASTAACRNQAFAVGRHVLALQFHPEVVGAAVESWLIGHAGELARTPGASVARIRADTRQYAGALEDRSRRLFHRWLDGACGVGG